MATPLLTTKLYIPPPLPNLVERPRLVKRLDEGLRLGHRLTLISAPAGFGKTTLVSDWLRRLDVPTAWVSLDESDNDPTRFLSYFVAALQTIENRQEPVGVIGKGALSALQSPQPPPTEAILTSLINEVAVIPDRIILVLDDYYLIEAQPIHDALTFLLEHLPPRMHLVIATRDDPQLPLARLRARGQLTELRATDLRFTSSEAAEFLNRAMGLNLSAEDIAALETRTEGWIAGLQLAAISMQGSEDATGFIKSFTGSHRYVLDYLIEEVLEQQPESVQAFLLQTAVLDRMTGSLCDAVRFGTAETPNRSEGAATSEGTADNSQATLEMLEHANLFIVALDEERCWYRYHHLFLELLRNQLRQTNPDLIPDLHLRAASWFEVNGYVQEAVKHALLHPDLNQAAQLIDRYALELLYQGEVQTVLDWFASLPESVMRSRPTIWISKAWALAVMWREDLHEEVENLLQKAESCLIESKADDNLVKMVRGHAASIQAILIQSPVARGHDPEKLITLAQRAQTLLPGDDYGIRSVNTLNIGYGYLELGNAQEADDAFRQTYRQGIEGGNFYAAVYGPINRAWIAFHLGRLDRMIKICQESLDEINQLMPDSDQHLPPVGGLHILLGAAWLEQNRLEQAEDTFTRGLGLIQLTGEYHMLFTGYTALTFLLCSQGQHNAAEEAIVALERSWPDGRFYTDALRMRLHFYKGLSKEKAIRRVRAWIEDVRGDVIAVDGVIRLTPWDVARQFQLLTWLRLNIALARTGRTIEDLHSIMERVVDLRDEAARHGFVKQLIELCLLESLIHEAMSEKDRALVPLKNAVIHAAQGGFVRIFVDEGPPIARLLYEAVTRGIVPDYARRLLAAFPVAEPEQADPAKTQAPNSGLVEPLSERELEVLELIAKGLTNPEIASRLFLAPNTVKTHARNIYGKLGVHNRTQAVARARALGVLPTT